MATTPHKRVGGGMSPTRHKATQPAGADVVNGTSGENGDVLDPKLHRRRGGLGFLTGLLTCVRSLRSDGSGGRRERTRLFALTLVGMAALVTVTVRREGRGEEAIGRPTRPSFPRVVGHYPTSRSLGTGPGGATSGGFHFERLDVPGAVVVPNEGGDADDGEGGEGGDDRHGNGRPSFVAHDAFRMKLGRSIEFTKEEREFQKSLLNSKRYNRKMRDPLHEGDCVPMRWWQETSFPTCNKLHEIIDTSTFAFLARGGYNDVFKVRDVADPMRTPYVLKVLKGPYDTEFTDRNFDRVRRDSLIMERTTASPYVMDIHGYCGFGQITTYSREGNLDGHIWHPKVPLSREYKLKLATQVAMGLTAVHDIDGDGRSAMSHGDYASKQYIKVGDVYKLNDFNRGRFIRWNEKRKEPCTYTIGKNDGKFRAPEEYAYTPESAKIDVWALGSIIFNILTGSSVWSGYDEREAQKALIDGKLPPMKSEIKESDDPIDRALLKAIDMCYVYEPKDRPDAGVVSDYLRREAKRLGVEVDVDAHATTTTA